MNVQELLDLDDDEFADEVDRNKGIDRDFAPFMHPDIAARTGEVLELFLVSVEMQLEAHPGGDDTDETWLRRSLNFQRLINFRLRQVRRRIRSTSSGDGSRERAWRAFAHEIAELAEDSDMAVGLHDIYTPFGDLDAQEWLDRRREKRARKMEVAA